ncbi:BET1-like protein isoform X1 [Macaca nemestrina]|uniref:BET1-like protein isoform X1 n=1 Tax=Macaca nemestrina TaxID=9545 RepID=UPI0005F53E6E|nr:BET1-like protein isoform X1 [Macaca nemestrina]
MADWARAQSPGAVEEILDRENKRMADSLASKVTRLKSLALDIDRDAEDQNRYLDGMAVLHKPHLLSSALSKLGPGPLPSGLLPAPPQHCSMTPACGRHPEDEGLRGLRGIGKAGPSCWGDPCLV